MKKTRRILLYLVCFTVLVCLVSGCATQSQETLQTFTNHNDGYCIKLDSSFAVDTSLGDICTIFRSEDTQIEIYRQDLTNIAYSTYTQYSNGFLANTQDHHKISEGLQRIGLHKVYVTAWSREKLHRVADDKNYYATFDIIRKDCVYSIFIKTSVPFTDAKTFYSIIKSFKVTDRVDSENQWSSKPVDPEIRNWNPETLDFYQTRFGDDAELAFGIFEPDTVFGNSQQIYYYEDVIDYHFPVVLCYSHFMPDPSNWDPYLPLDALLEKTWADGQVLELTLQATTTADGSNMVYQILQGEHDAFLRYYAQAIADFGHPVLFRLHNEMNGDWCPYSGYNTSKDSMIYKQVYWYIYEIFEEAGANKNTIWVWNPNHKSFPDFNWNHSLMYYPGDAYVDVVGMTAYNTGTYYAEYGETWQSFDALYADLYDEYCSLLGQPLMITEFSCANMGGDKNAWVEDMFQTLAEFDRIKVAVWWDHADYDADGNVSRSYVLDESPELLEIFRKNLAH